MKNRVYKFREYLSANPAVSYTHLDVYKRQVISLTKKSIEIDNTKLTLGSNIYSKEEMENSFGKGFLDYLNKVLSYEKIDWGLYEGFHGNAECCKQIKRFY